jgi:hypothetical protein
MVALLTAFLAGGCGSTNTTPTTAPTTSPQGRAISQSDIPTAIVAAFAAEHPYDKIHDPRQVDDSDGATRYIIPYTRPDGSEGSLTYAPTGEVLGGY